MTRLNVRRGATAGLAVSLVLAATIAASSSTPFQTFIYVLAIAVAFSGLAVGIVVVIDRARQRRSER